MKYQYANNSNEAVGPVEESHLHELFNRGEIKRETNILSEGADTWLPYSSLLAGPPPPSSNSAIPPIAGISPQQSAAEAMQRCPYCSEHVFATAKKCKHCGETLDVALRAAEEAKKSSSSQQQPMVFMNAGGGGGGSSAASSSSSGGGYGPIVGTKSRIVAALLAFFLGGIGVHKFYLGQTAMGVVYLIFSWTFIPMIISWIEGLLYLLSTERAFALKYG